MLLKTNGRNSYFDIVGREGAPVVYFAHSLAADSGMWSEQVPAFLAAGYRVLRVDMRGHGGSDPAPGNYTMEQLVEDAVSILDYLAIPKVHFCGLSIGGMIGQGFALANPDRLLSLTLCDTQPSTPPGSTGAWDERKAVVRKAGTLAALADSTMERWFTDEFKQVNATRWREVRDTISNTTPAGFLGCASAIQDFNYEDRLHTIKVPTLVICGDEDAGTPPDRNQLIAAKVPGGRYEGIAKARHLPNVERPEQFNRILMGWLGLNR